MDLLLWLDCTEENIHNPVVCIAILDDLTLWREM
ncbi:MAG: hypothetical protein BWY45_01239 [Euryarchaeota archaeon ADurb.Bin294]|nr:MAG: hypothetical protein BWY45_01239 [Euryarchaeota archaeon ADurb.Bin294]